MSIQVVVSSTAAGVSVSGGTAVAITVGSVSASVPVTVSGGIGPAGFIVDPGTASSAFGTFQLAAGNGITISTSVGQFQIASYGTAAVSSLAPVQSVAGRVGAVQLQASDVTAGTFAIARIPTISYTALANVPATVSPAAHTHSTSDVVSFTAAAAAAAPVQSVAGRSGAISLTASDVSGLASVATSGSYTSLSNTPASFAPQAHTHALADLTQSSATKGQVPTWNGTVWAAATPSPGGVTSIAGRTGDVTLAQLASSGTASASTFLRGDGAWATAGSTDAAPTEPISIYHAPGNARWNWSAPSSGSVARYELQLTFDNGATWSVESTSITTTTFLRLSGWSGPDPIARVRAISANNVIGPWGYEPGVLGAEFYTLPTASASVLGGIKVGSGLAIASGVLSTTGGGGGGGSANIVEAATAAGFPATGASSTLYIATDSSTVFRFDSSGVYIEIGN
jgi:hypothetical protein